ncbi:heme-binding protein, partial [Streptomyces sp. P17]|uniref:GlcG/HbpS family heme-binding protein n=1 Tax=Streptomyces sp. P17 TaxID=3074716 RepID=UPI0028F44709
MPYLKLADAKSIIAATFSRAGELGLTRPLSVAVLDAGGHLIAFERQDRSSMLRFEIAFGKAYGALAVGAGSREVAKMAVESPSARFGLS